MFNQSVTTSKWGVRMRTPLGKRNRRITIQSCRSITDSEGYQKEVWQDINRVWAYIKNLHGNEFFKAQAVNSKATCKMNIRYMQGLDTKMRISYGGKFYNILYIDDIEERHIEIELLCEVVV